MLAEAGFTAAEFQVLTGDQEVKAALKQATEEAVERGVFGAPTCFVDGQMYFGQDRLDFVADALKL
ncbi:2-hydroxychromene-2-carboxylate isomerase [compost metagenome]